MKRIIYNGILVNEGVIQNADIIINDDRIESIVPAGKAPRDDYDEEIDATGCLVMPGVIDTHVHFREPGMTHKADIESESRAAAFGGVTSFFDMPNTNPQTTTLEALSEKYAIAAEKSHINYAFFIGATNSNAEVLDKVDIHTIPGIKLFMGSSTGNMLVDRDEALGMVFSKAAELDLPIMAHCEDTAIINANMQAAKEKFGDDPEVIHHPEIRSAEACYQSSAKGVALAKKYGTRFHIAHITTARELDLIPHHTSFTPQITAEATVAHLLFTDDDYKTLGTRIKCNPAIKTLTDRNALRKALTNGIITTIGTDHAPHALSEKEGGAAKAVSGMPMLQFSLVSMLELIDEGILTVERLVELMCHNPARLFSVRERGFIRPGYKADIAIVAPRPWQLKQSDIQSKCGWSPLEGRQFQWSVVHTICNGCHIFNNGQFDKSSLGEQIRFR